MKLKHKVVAFTLYFILFLALGAMVDYYAYDILNPWIFIVLSFAAALWVTKVHAKSRQKSRVDELAEEIEEVL